MAKNKRKNKKIKIKKGNNIKEPVYNDILAVSFLALALILALSLYVPKSAGIIGNVLGQISRTVFGLGAFSIPFLLVVISIIYFMNSQDRLRISIYGLLIVLTSCLGLTTLYYLKSGYFNIEKIQTAGGLLGSILAYPSIYLLGRTGAFIVLIAFSLIGLLLTVNKPLIELLNLAKDKSKKIQSTIKPSKKTISLRENNITEPIDFGSETKVLTNSESKDKEESKEGEPETKKEESRETPAVVSSKDKTTDYRLPPQNLLKQSKGKIARSAKELKTILERTLRDFNVPARVTGIQEGPTVTTFELQLEPGTKVQKLLSLQDDLSLALATPNIRILTPIPGKSAIGIEVPNIIRALVTLGDLMQSEEWSQRNELLLLPLGKDITGKPFFFDLREMPHMLIAGATGSGKSVCLNSVITSILYRSTPDNVKMVLVDPKRVEFNHYKDIPHLLAPVITETKQASSALSYIVDEMEKRFEKLSSLPARDINTYNQKAFKNGSEPMPYIVVVIDELADLMMISAREVEEAIVRISQMARAVGIHLIVATQRPSANIITGLIKSNITTRIAFSVSSQVDSRVIIDTPGAEKLIGKGDLLFITQSLLKPRRLQSPYITEEEVEKVTDFIKSQEKPEYIEDVLNYAEEKKKVEKYEDELFEDAVEQILLADQASTSFLQRKLRIGYARAARIMDSMEAHGIVGPQEGSKPRDILISREDWQKMRKGL